MKKLKLADIVFLLLALVVSGFTLAYVVNIYPSLPDNIGSGGVGKQLLWYIAGASLFCFISMSLIALFCDYHLPFRLSEKGKQDAALVIRRCILLLSLLSSSAFLYAVHLLVTLSSVKWYFFTLFVLLLISIIAYGFIKVTSSALRFGLDEEEELSDDEAKRIIEDFKKSSGR